MIVLNHTDRPVLGFFEEEDELVGFPGSSWEASATLKGASQKSPRQLP